MAKEVSKHASRLRELGCTPFSEILSSEDMDDVDNTVEAILGVPTPNRMSRSQRRKLIKRKVLPGFLDSLDNTYVLDETGADWCGPPGIKGHLVALKFCNIELELTLALNKKMH